jgi:DNA-binding winged helix-turn-helix (wHTH) protein/Tol biopolymer transport system component
MEERERPVYVFGDFCLEAKERLLTCGGKPVPLGPKTFDMLLLLVQNAGSLVEKDVLLESVWNDTCVEEGNLAKHVSLLRKALGDVSNGGSYIATVPKRGYRFVAEVSELRNGAVTAQTLEGPVTVPPEDGPEADHRRWPQIKRMLAGAFLTAALAALGWVLWPLPAPKVRGMTQLTHVGRAWWTQRVLTDGVRLYFAERTGGRELLAWAPAEGGEPVVIPTPFANTVLLDISADHAWLLLAGYEGEDEAGLWTMPTTGGSPERVGTLTATDAVWLPNGRGILFVRGRDIYDAAVDGSSVRKVASTDGRAGHFRWSPDGRVLRFTVEDARTGAVTIWEAAGDGSQAHPWSAFRNERKAGFLVGECCGVWTPDGKYFIYRSSDGKTTGLWARREWTGLRSGFRNRPFLLHTFPSALAFFDPLVSADGKRIFFVAEQESRELVRYEVTSGSFVPYLSGVPARRVDVSPNGEWVTYYTQDYRLWRSRVDGSDRLQLTFPPLNVATPRWSSDGRFIAFRGDLPGISSRIYMISRDGGSPEAITPAQFLRADYPCWTPDGNSLIFGEFEASGLNPENPALHKLDLNTRDVEKLAGSEGLAPQDVSPDGREVAAFTLDDARLMLFDLATGRRTEVARGTSLYGAFWSRDGKYIYFQDLSGGVEQQIYRVGVSDHRVEAIAGLSQFSRADAMAFSLAGLAPDGSPLASLMLSRGDVYALDVDFP